ncbi:AP2 domain-containing protein [Kurthia sibirica]|uniref:AP2 domain-containing protein n=1 Tax=Kurthia sibirica TaxID=202750 RepID=A0A2U3ALZ6_9BACL|nr:AP2 domain-containing protein [Kurthia sibirica]PWI25566.1 AP2 domain-containing protein [Kurthia sibirica]GEK33945.1 AP2 domain-containing protein [Kurthia sibirica]
MKKKHYIGKRYGRLVVTAEIREKNTLRLKVLCDCGHSKIVYYSNLSSGRTKSCGCLEVKNRQRYRDLLDMTFGELTVFEKTDKRAKEGSIIWLCRCNCGEEKLASARNLLRGQTTHCGSSVHKKQFEIGELYGKLTVLRIDIEKDSIECQCDCGETVSVSARNLKYGHTRSCGCLKKIDYRTIVDGTCIEQIRSKKISKANKSGVRGVSKIGNQWQAYIGFKGRNIALGRFNHIQQATNARKQAEIKYYNAFLAQYDRGVEISE